jgi:hypothetical protein
MQFPGIWKLTTPFFWSIIYLFTILFAHVPEDDMLMCANRDPDPLSLTVTLDFDLATVS